MGGLIAVFRAAMGTALDLWALRQRQLL